MPKHIVVDGSNLATEGRSMPSLKQLSDAVEAYLAEYPTELVTVVVDATFGHRIDPREVADFEEAIDHNELVAPPAGAVGRGDAFILAIANKVNAIILSNDSFQEFHGDYPWLFDEGRLVGGKPVPHVGWVFVERVPVRGPLSRKSTREARTKDAPRDTVRTSAASLRPMPVPKAPPPRSGPAGGPSRPPADRSRRAPSLAPAGSSASGATEAHRVAPPAAPARNAMVNDLMPFLEFVEKYPVGTLIDVVVETYSSHGAYVVAGGARAYLPLRNIADPAPRSARELFKLGETVTVQVAAFHAARRGIDLAIPGIVAGLVAPPVVAAKPTKGRARKAVVEAVPELEVVEVVEVPDEPAAKPARRGRGGKQVTVETPAEVDSAAAPTKASPSAKAPGRRRQAARAGLVDLPPAEPVSAAARSRRRPSTRDAAAATAATAADVTIPPSSEPVLVAEPSPPPATPPERAKPVRKSSPKTPRAPKTATATAVEVVDAAVADVPVAAAPTPAKPARRTKATDPVVEAEPTAAKPAAKRSRAKA